MNKNNTINNSEIVIQEVVEDVKSALCQRDAKRLHLSLSKLHDLLYKPILRYTKRFTFLSEMQQEEVVSETFFRVFSALGAYQTRPGVKFISWVFKIARNIIYDQWASSRSRSIPHDKCVYLDDRVVDDNSETRQTYADIIPSSDLTPEYQVLSKEVNYYYQQCLLDMKPVDLLILYWRTGDRLSHREIANRLSDYQGKYFTETSVRQRYHRSQELLKERVYSYGAPAN